MSKRILTAVLLGLAVASNGVFAQSVDTTGSDRSAMEQQKSEPKAVAPDYHNDDSPNYPFTA